MPRRRRRRGKKQDDEGHEGSDDSHTRATQPPRVFVPPQLPPAPEILVNDDDDSSDEEERNGRPRVKDARKMTAAESALVGEFHLHPVTRFSMFPALSSASQGQKSRPQVSGEVPVDVWAGVFRFVADDLVLLALAPVCRTFARAVAIVAAERLDFWLKAVPDDAEDWEVRSELFSLLKLEWTEVSLGIPRDQPCRLDFIESRRAFQTIVLNRGGAGAGGGDDDDNDRGTFLLDVMRDTFHHWYEFVPGKSDGHVSPLSALADGPDPNPGESASGGFPEPWFRNFVEALTTAFRSGQRVPLNTLLLRRTLGAMLRENTYVISSWDPEVPQAFEKEQLDELVGVSRGWFGEGDNIMEALSFPSYALPPEGIKAYWFGELLLSVVPVQPRESLDAERLKYYRDRFRDPSYAPTVLVMVPPTRVSPRNPVREISPAGVLLDGHHKLRMAFLLGRPVRILLVQRSHKIYKEVEPLPWRHPTKRLVKLSNAAKDG
jgi:hypothetical protein